MSTEGGRYKHTDDRVGREDFVCVSLAVAPALQTDSATNFATLTQTAGRRNVCIAPVPQIQTPNKPPDIA